MIRYVSMTVKLQGLKERTLEDVQGAVIAALEKQFPECSHKTDIEVVIDEHAGKEEPEES